jgi:hypothetical protein
MRTVSFLGPEEGESGAGVTEADKGVETAGGFGGEAGEGGGGGSKNWGDVTFGTAGFEIGGGSAGVPNGGLSDDGRTGNWIRTVSRDFVFGSGGFAAG